MPVRSYLKLHESECPLSSSAFMPSLTDSLTQVFEYLEDGGELLADRAWGLAPSVAAALCDRAGYSPAGGWSELVGLAVGAQIFDVTHESFVAAMPLAELVVLDEHTLRRRLVEAATVHMVPPAFIASLGHLLDLHPAWALRAVRAIRGDDGELPSTWKDEASFPPARVKRVSTILIDVLASLVAALRSLRPAARYDLNLLMNLAADVAVALTRDERDICSSGIDVFVHPAGQNKARSAFEFVHDLFALVLEPSGAAARLEDGTFCVLAGAFEQVHVAELDVDAQRLLLAHVLPADVAAS